MRPVLLWALLLCSSCIGEARDFTRIDGLVVDDATGTPVGKAVVLLDSGYGPDGRRHGAVTDSSGKFSMPEVRPRTYVVKVERAGYVSVTPVATLDILAGQQTIDVTLKLTRQGIIAGRVTGPPDLLPAPYQLNLWKTSLSGRYRTAEPSGRVRVEDDGNFMIGNLAPGRYFLEKPGMSLADAIVLDVTAGNEIRGIQVRQQPAASNRISGVTRNPVPGSSMNSGLVHLETKDPSGSWVSLRTYAPIHRQTGAFTFRSIPPGDYRIRAITSIGAGSSSRKYFGTQEVHLQGRSATEVSLTFTPMAVVTGTISEEAKLPERSQPLYVTLYGDGPDSEGGDSAQVTLKRTFRLQVVPGRHRVFAGNGLENVRLVKSIRLNGRDAPVGGTLDISAEGGTLDVLFGGPGREIVGTIRDSARRSVAGGMVAVWTNEGALSTAVADVAGHFTILNAPRGLVYVAASESADAYPWQQASVRAAFQRFAAKLPAQGPFRVTVELVAIRRAAMAAEVAKLP